MKLLDRIDDVVFGAVDAAVLWAWNDLGVSWRTLVLGVFAADGLCSVLRASDGGRHYDAFALFVAACFLLMGLAVHVWLSVATGAGNVSLRRQVVPRVGRALLIACVVGDAVIGHWRSFVADVVGLLFLLVFYAAIPSGPRRPKRRAVSALAPVRGAA